MRWFPSRGDGRIGRRRLLRWAFASILAVFLAIQLIPYGHDHANPPVSAEPKWDSTQTRELTMTACGDCHSNQTTWPWYSNIAPISWLVQGHVDGGRSSLNFSTWDKPQDASIGDIVEAIQSGSMPTWDYKLLHPSANLSSAQKAALVRGLTATLATSPPIGGGG
ncbi:MAG TPA: heme-binding domain-containing protein [Gaiellales bacterium]|nr:heme-binding domain-containing protein [Gaiellales bacterium]